ncbi:hypothetical protein INT47_003503 [Mucor saturninus]|uniref:HCP-like protein n=1 Tax=Mucor saturninus TaxID=64648 RepID=A0A8H7V941_9FUNG|nr:hypothetical protein INT47_003503 [Mucor saturninus]
MKVLYQLSDYPEPGDKDLSMGIQFMNQNDYTNALHHFEKASTYNNEYGLLFFAIFNFTGLGLEKRDVKKALIYYNLAATEWQNRVAKNLLGMLYFDGDENIPEDYITAKKWLTLAADNGWICAMVVLGHGHRNGWFGKTDLERAIFWLEKVTNNTTKDEDVDFLFDSKLFKMDRSHVPTEIKTNIRDKRNQGLISLYLLAKTVSRNDDNAAMYQELLWNLLTNKQSDSIAIAQKFLGMVYMDGDKIIKIDRAKSFHWFKNSGINGNAEACSVVGSCYKDGTGVEHNTQEAIRWYIKAAEMGGDTDELQDAGTSYFKIGPKRDYKLALQYFEALNTVTESGKACFFMSNIYLEGGDGVKPDYKKAMELALESMKKGSPPSASAIGMIYLKGLGVKEDEEKAHKYLLQGVSMKCPRSMFILGGMYHEGYQGKVDLDKALEYLYMSAEAGFLPAQYMINQVTMLQSMNVLEVSSRKNSKTKERRTKKSK